MMLVGQENHEAVSCQDQRPELRGCLSFRGGGAGEDGSREEMGFA